jgi:hypothetical protein
VDTAADYRTLLEGGIVVWPVEKAVFDLEMGDRPEGPLDEWTRNLVAWAEADGLRAGLFWFKAGRCLLTGHSSNYSGQTDRGIRAQESSTTRTSCRTRSALPRFSDP